MWRIIAILCLATITIFERQGVNADPVVPCFFIFGDSLFDAGNNNDLETKAKANFPPYGIDFINSVPTGRFTNGRTSADFLAEKLGFDRYIPPFTTAKRIELLEGVNYASGSCGIRNETGRHLGVCVHLGQQLEHHKSVIDKVKNMVHGNVQDYLGKCLYAINVGSNDYINNYFMPKIYPTNKYSYDQYADLLVNQYTNDVKVLYESGARKIAVFGIGYIGCTLAKIAQFHPQTPCVNSINIAVARFNERLKSLVDQLPKTLPGLYLVYVNMPAIKFGPAQGVTVSNKPCCNLRKDYQCKGKKGLCENRSTYAFFDGFHPTEAVNRLTVEKFFNSSPGLEVFPYNINELVNL